MFTFTIKPDEGQPYELTADSRDISMWERTTHKASMGSLVKDMKMSELEKIACFAARRSGRFDGEMDRFRAECAIEFHEDDEEDEIESVLDEHEAGEIDAETAIARIRELRDPEAEREPDPTLPAQSAGTSSASPSPRASRRKSGGPKATGR